MILDLVALVLLVVFAWRGARRGALASGLSLAAVVVGYAAAWLAATRMGDEAGRALGMPALLGAPLAGTAAFLTVGAAIALASWLLQRGRDRAHGVASRAGGALFGVVRGSLVVLMLGILSVWLDAWQGAQEQGAAPPSVATLDTPLRLATRTAIGVGVEAALGRTPSTELAVRALTRPAETMTALRELAAQPEIVALAEDRELWAYVESGAYEAALAQPSFQRLQWNGERRRELAAAGLVDEIAAGDPAIFALELRAVLAQIGPRLRALREDPDLARLASDPAVADLVQRRDIVALLAHPGFQRVVSRALSPPTGPG